MAARVSWLALLKITMLTDRERERRSSFSLTFFHNTVKTLWHVCLLLKMLEVAVAFVDGGGCWVWWFLFSQDQLVCSGVSAILNLTPGTAPP